VAKGAERPLGSVRDPVVDEADKRLHRCIDYESICRTSFVEDLKFAEADADNGFAWPDAVRRNRDIDERPCLTVNRTRQHNLQIINDSKQNKPGIVIRGTGNGATYESAKTYESIVRNIEYQSNAQTAYSTATEFQVKCGIGWIRVTREYRDEESFEQDLFIRRVNDPLSVYIDPDAKEADKSDAKFCFVFDDVLKDDFEDAYPELNEYALGDNALGIGGIVSKDHIRVVEYFRKLEVKDELAAIRNPQTGQMETIRKSKLPSDIWKDIKADKTIQRRPITFTKIERYLIVGDQIAEQTEELGKYIPLVPVIGEETIIDGKLDRKGHTRALKDPGRIYNYWTSSAVEHVALQGKTPWVAPAAAIEDYEGYWNTANRVNHSVLPYNAYDDAGNALPEPHRTEPPNFGPAYLSGMQVAVNEMMMVSGQYQPQMGEPSNERSGKALAERQRQGDNATYHFIDNLGVALRHVGRILLDQIPLVYDTRRVMQILALDGTDFEIEVDPSARQAYVEHLNHDQEVVKRIFNPKLGKYDVQADIGPAYGTQRQQMFDALTTLIAQAPDMANLVGDIWMRAADFPGADEAAERFKRMLPPQALGKGPSQAEQQLQLQVQNLTQLLTKALDKEAGLNLKLKGKDEMREIDAYEADTRRLKVLADHGIDKGTLALSRASLQHDIAHNQMQLVQADQHKELDLASQGAAEGGASAPKVAGNGNGAGGGEASSQPPVPGARKARDGHWYVPDPTRPGKYALVA
jgi:Phage P22-like portal protein